MTASVLKQDPNIKDYYKKYTHTHIHSLPIMTKHLLSVVMHSLAVCIRFSSFVCLSVCLSRYVITDIIGWM